MRILRLFFGISLIFVNVSAVNAGEMWEFSARNSDGTNFIAGTFEYESSAYESSATKFRFVMNMGGRIFTESTISGGSGGLGDNNEFRNLDPDFRGRRVLKWSTPDYTGDKIGMQTLFFTLPVSYSVTEVNGVYVTTFKPFLGDYYLFNGVGIATVINRSTYNYDTWTDLTDVRICRVGEQCSPVVLTTAVPEVDSFGMLLAGLGWMGFVMRRQQKVEVA